MKDLKLFFFLSLAATGLLFTSCDKDDDDDDDHNHVTITIDEPIDGETIADCSEVHIHIDFVAEEENHEIEVKLHPEGDTDSLIIDYDAHDHDMEIHFEEEVNLCDFPSGTCFHLEVVACEDHDCEETATAETEFCIQ